DGSEASQRTASHLRREGSVAHAEGRSGDRSTSREEGSGEARGSHPAPHLLLAPCDEGSTGESDSGTGGASGPDHNTAVHAPDASCARGGDQVVGWSGSGQSRTLRPIGSWRNRGGGGKSGLNCRFPSRKWWRRRESTK